MGIIFNTLKRLIKTIIKLSCYFVLFITIIVLIPNLPPYTKFTTIELPAQQPRVGSLAPNEALNNAGRSYKGKLLGPEAFQIYKGELYTSLATGEIVKLSPGGHVTFVTTVGQPCSGLIKEHICGRPLGFQIDEKAETLYVADAYHGIWKVDLRTDKKQLLVSPRVEIDKRKPKLFNSLSLAKNGDLYWTDSTSDYNLKDGALSCLTDPSGRLFHYNAAKNQSEVLLDNLWFPNGVVLSPNNEFIVVAETSRSSLLKYYIAGPKKGQSETLVDGLPGVPDNIRALPDGSGLLVGLYSVFDDDSPNIARSLAAAPVIRKFLVRLQHLIELPFEHLNRLYPHILFEEIVYHIGHFKSVSGLLPAMSGLLQLDWNGNIIATYYNTDGSLGHISDAIVYKDKLYTGSPHQQDFLGTLPAPPLLKKAFESPKKSDAPKTETKSQQTKPVQQPVKQKVEAKQIPKVQEKEKVETNNKVEEPKVTTKPIENKPNVEEKKQAPKEVEKTKAEKVSKSTTAAPKLAEKDKVVESAKQAQKPAADKPNPKVQSAQKAPTTPPPTPKPEPAEKVTKSDPKPAVSKPEVKTTPPPKPTEKTTPPQPKATTPMATETKPQAAKKTEPPVKQTAESKPKPIKEEIPSDTVKPAKETLRVITRDGPTEMPVP